jgi:hypothetical protein
MNQEELVKNWAFEKNLELECYIDSGQWGDAYEITENNVIKITRDYEEFICAYKLLGKDTKHNAKIKEMRVFPTGELGILLEKVDTVGVEDTFGELLLYANEKEIDILDIEDQDTLSAEAFKMSSDIYKGLYEIIKNGYNGSDISGDNIGINSSGDYVLFDQRDKTNPFFVDQDIFEEIKNKLRVQYEIEEDEPIIKKNVPIEKILVSEDSIKKTIKDIENKRVSQTEENIECMYNEDGELQLIDGNHRLLEKILLGKTNFDVTIVHDERTGYSHQYFSLVKRENAIEFDSDKIYCGLENIFADEYLEKCIDILEKLHSENIEDFLTNKSPEKKQKRKLM